MDRSLTISDNYTGQLRLTVRNYTYTSTLNASAIATATSVNITDTTSGLSDGQSIQIQMDNGLWHATTVSGVSGTAPDDVTLTLALPYAAASGNAVQRITPFTMTYPTTTTIQLPESNPTTTTNYTNEYPWPVFVSFSGGTTVDVYINGIDTLLGTGMTYVVPPGGTIRVDHAGAPSWKWYQAG
jgi:hypothetical protein